MLAEYTKLSLIKDLRSDDKMASDEKRPFIIIVSEEDKIEPSLEERRFKKLLTFIVSMAKMAER